MTTILGKDLLTSGLYRSQEFGSGGGKLQEYKHANVFPDGDNMVIQAVHDGTDYTAGRIVGKNMLHYKYFRMTFRIKVPWVSGSWCSPWMGSDQIPEDNPESDTTKKWPYYPELDLAECNKNGVKGRISNGYICNPQVNQPALDMVEVFNMTDYNADPDAFNDWTIERTETTLTYKLNDQTFRTINKADLNAHRQATWDTWCYPLLDYQISKDWAGVPQVVDYQSPVLMEIASVDVVDLLAPVEPEPEPEPIPEPIPEPEPTPEPDPPEEPVTEPDPQTEGATMNATVVKNGKHWKVVFSLTGQTLNKTMGPVLKLSEDRKKPVSLVTPIWYTQDLGQHDITYWLETIDGHQLSAKRFVQTPEEPVASPEPESKPGTDTIADIKAAMAYNRALAKQLRNNADDLDRESAILEGVLLKVEKQ